MGPWHNLEQPKGRAALCFANSGGLVGIAALSEEQAKHIGLLPISGLTFPNWTEEGDGNVELSKPALHHLRIPSDGCDSSLPLYGSYLDVLHYWN